MHTLFELLLLERSASYLESRKHGVWHETKPARESRNEQIKHDAGTSNLFRKRIIW